MGSEEAKEIYKERASTAECVNAQARNRGLVQLFVRGRRKVKAVALWVRDRARRSSRVAAAPVEAAMRAEVALAG